MRKIYPSLFNKFTVFVLYGLLSIAAITLAQESMSKSCGLNPIDFSNHVTMGYIRLSKNPPDFNAIQWELYDFINVVASPKEGTPWNSILSSKNADVLASIDGLIDAKIKSNSDTKILLSIRNYDPVTWPVPKDGVDGVNYQLQYDDIITDTIETLKKVDGVDIEYPGMRGLYCNDPDPDSEKSIWVEGDGGRGKKDEDFTKFLTNLKGKMGKMGEKTLMVTVGRDTFGLQDEQIDFLNIETHHFSLYQNIRDPPEGFNIKSYPNSPLSEFTDAYDGWIAKGIQSKKIIMGIDFGNTFQVVDNPDIAKSPIVEFAPINNENFRDDPDLKNLAKISSANSLCSNFNPIDEKLYLYSFPWKDLSKSVFQTGCDAKSDWIRKFDEEDSMTPWLYRNVAKTPDPDDHQFISYEDFTSLSKKLNLFMGKIGGISISDVSYDDGSLLDFISSKEVKSSNPGSPTPGTGTGTGGKNSTSPTTDPAADAGGNSDSKLVNKKAIAGGVIGGLFGLIILGACIFIGYRYRKKPKSESFRSLLMSIPSSIKNHSTASRNARNTEMTSDPSPNMFAPPTTVIPVASGYVTAMFDFTGKEENDLSFKKGDKIEVLERGDGPNDWWVGRVNGAVGEFPGNYVKET